MKKLELEGMRFGRLLVKSVSDIKNTRGRNWNCICDCGNECVVLASSMKGGLIMSCGCFYKDSRKDCNKSHGMSRTREYNAWAAMKQRCYYEKHDYYDSYGGRGITVCERWLHSFENFYEDMGDCPKGMSIERVEVNGNYEPSNCKWDTASNQGYNTRMSSANKSGKTGVCWHKVTGKWMASIRHNGKPEYLGVFDLLEDAIEARKVAELKYYGRNKQ